jgi:hypothetical protein
MGRPRSVERITFNCHYCGSVVEERKNRYEKRKRFNCSDSVCVSKAKAHTGTDNGMYGRTHTDDVKTAQSIRSKILHTGVTYEQRYGKEKADELKAIRSNVFKRTWENPDRTLSFLGKTHSSKTKEIIGTKSSAKFTNEFKEEHYYATGRWTRPEEKSDLELYNELSFWCKRMWDIIDDTLLIEHGVWHASKNPNGCVRDHIVSRKFGFDNKVYPEIIRHPANCQILLHKKNSSKGPNSDLTLDELFAKIETYDKDWFEHGLVLSLIELYRNGNRWNRKEAVSE